MATVLTTLCSRESSVTPAASGLPPHMSRIPPLRHQRDRSPTPDGRAASPWPRLPLLAGLSAFLCLSGCSKAGPAVAPPARVVPVLAATAVQKTIPVQVRTIGTVEAYTTVAIKSMVTGELEKVHFTEGQEVKKGEVLFTIDPRPFQATLHQVEANLARDTALAENARIELQRNEELLKTQSVPKRQYDLALATSAATDAAVRADKAAVENAQLQLGYCTIDAPMDGRTGNVMIHAGNLVKANDLALLTINQLRPIYTSFTVPEQYLPQIQQCMTVGPLSVEVVIPGAAGAPVKGTLIFVDNAVDHTTGTIRLKATFPNQDNQLWPGQFVNTILTLATERDKVVVPSQAVDTGQKGQYVFVIKPDLKVEYRTVATGLTIEDETVIEKGLGPGEQVVTDGQLQLIDGTKVVIKTGLEPVKEPRS
jgi:multidrug efflux system membrane fusion protein